MVQNPPRGQSEPRNVRPVFEGPAGGRDEPTVEIGGQVMTQAQFDAARSPLLNPAPGPVVNPAEVRCTCGAGAAVATLDHGYDCGLTDWLRDHPAVRDELIAARERPPRFQWHYDDPGKVPNTYQFVTWAEGAELQCLDVLIQLFEQHLPPDTHGRVLDYLNDRYDR